jgi:DNA-binding MarR family transcriptional regulator
MSKNQYAKIFRNMSDTVDELRSKVGHAEVKLWTGLTFNQLRMIKYVCILTRENPGGITLKVLAESLQITPAAASEMVDALVHKNMLQRDHNQQDRRAVSIRLSEACQERFAKYDQLFFQLTEEFCKSLPEEEVDQFFKTLAAFHQWVTEKVSESGK